MPSLLFGISLAALLSFTSLLVILFRVSPLSAPAQALPAFFASLCLTIATIGTLLFFGLWKIVPLHTWDAGKLLSIAFRQGIFLAIAMTLLVFLHIAGLFSWWIGVLVCLVFILVELAMNA